MKIPVFNQSSAHNARVIKGLASAAVIMSLTACGADSLEDIEGDLANGESVSINLSLNDDGDLVVSLDDQDMNDAVMNDDGMNDTGTVPANTDAVFVTPEMVEFFDTPFPGVQLAPAFNNDDTGAHETFIRVAAGGAIPPHIHTQGTWSVVVDGPMEIPSPIDEMDPMMMVTGSAGFVPPSTEHLMGCLNPTEDCLFLIHQDGPFDVTPTGNMAVENGTSARNPEAIEVPFSETEGWIPVGIPGVDFRPVVGNFSVQDGTQHGTLVRVQGGMGIPPHFHTLQARGYVLLGDVEVPVPYNQTNPTTIQPGGYFAVPPMAVHEMNCASSSTCIFYLRQDGDFDFTPTGDAPADADADADADAGGNRIAFSLNSEITVPPANVDGASGEAHFTIDTQTGAISGSVTVEGLTGPATAAHIHAGAPGEAGPVVVGLESNDDGTVWSVPEGAALDADALALLEMGNLYVNVHTEANAPGEVRGQLVDEASAAPGTITVTMTNTSPYQPMTPPVVVLHNAPDAENGMRLFYPSQPANNAIVAIAENGDNGPMVNQLGYLTDQGRASAFAVGFPDPENPGPLLPGMSSSVELDLVSDDQVLSLVSMVVCTNDGFSGVNGHTLSMDTTETFLVPIYDAGSESNVLMLDYWVPPCGSDANMTDDENGAVALHPGQSGSENPNFDFAADTRLLEVTITRN